MRRFLKSKKDQFISGYVQAKYPAIYNDVHSFYQKLESKYPKKKDLRKTDEFLRQTTQFQSHSEMYKVRKLQAEKRKRQSEKENKKNNKFVDNMELKIPLINDIPDGQTANILDHPIDDKTYQELLQSLRSDSNLYSIFDDINVNDMSQEEQIEITVLEHQTTTPESITNHQYQEQQTEENNQQIEDIIQEICKDPELYHIFNGEQTPLEKELAQLGY